MKFALLAASLLDDSFVVPWMTYVAITEALGECHMRHETDENSVIRGFVHWLRKNHAKPPRRKPREE